MRRAAFAILSTVAGLVGLLTFKTHTTTLAGVPAAVSSSGSSSSASAAPSSSSSSSSSTSSKKSTSASTTKTITGDASDTPYGPVQVQVTVTNGKITNVTAVEYPSDPRSEQINSYALPVLYQETISANSADIDTVSGATYTSEGYVNSLQSALDQL